MAAARSTETNHFPTAQIILFQCLDGESSHENKERRLENRKFKNR